MTEYQTLYADPPWQFGDKLPGPSRGAEKNYATLSLPELMRFLAREQVEVADNARLFLWRVASMQEEALALMESWDFTLKAEVVWVKTTASGKRHFGMGRTVRMEHEVCLIGQRGKPPVLNHSTRSVLTAPYTRHSGKPDAMYDLIEGLSPGPYLELFARNRRPGWDAIGDEL